MRERSIRLALLGTILVYVLLHVTEEAVGDFPLFMHENWAIPNIGYARWLYHNLVVFLPVLLVGYSIFTIDETRFLFLGVGIPLWGLLNFLEHVFYTVKNGAVSPGTWTSLLFAALFVTTIVLLKEQRRLSPKLILLSLGASLAYWAVPIAIVMTMGDVFARYIH
jgi:hypothetical protein